MSIFTQKVTEVMNWAEFIIKIEEGLFGKRFSDYDLANITGISREVIYKIRKGKTTDPQQSTVSKVEEALKIKIDKNDPDNISYTRIQPASVNEPQGKYETEVFTKERREMIAILESQGIDSVEKLESFYDYAEIIKDLDAITKTRVEKILKSKHK